MLDIRPISSIEEARAIEELVMDAWGRSERNTVPDHLTITIAKHSGCVLLATENGVPVGFCLSFLAHNKQGGLKHHSHMAAVHPDWQGRQIGAALKWAQRDWALARGIEQITWTFDPLEAMNARFNLHKLGAVCATYERNVYGTGNNALTMGIDTDRFLVDWWLTSERVVACAQAKLLPDFSEVVAFNQIEMVAGLPVPRSAETAPPTTRQVVVQIPANMQQLKSADMALAKRWRTHSRAQFETLFAAGYTAVDFAIEGGLGRYLFEA